MNYGRLQDQEHCRCVGYPEALGCLTRCEEYNATQEQNHLAMIYCSVDVLPQSGTPNFEQDISICDSIIFKMVKKYNPSIQWYRFILTSASKHILYIYTFPWDLIMIPINLCHIFWGICMYIHYQTVSTTILIVFESSVFPLYNLYI